MPRPSEKKKQPVQSPFSDPQDILMDAPIGIFISTPGGRYISVNPALARMYGYDSPEELIESVTDIAEQLYVDPEDRKEFIRLLEEHGEVANHESRRLRRDGTVFWVSMNARAMRDEEGRIVAWQGFTTDISDRKLAEQRERVSEERFRLMFMNAPMPYQSLDEQGNFLDVNQTFLDVLGYSREEVIGRNFSDILHPDWVDHFRENFPRFKAVGEILGVEFEMVKNDGTTILVFFNGKIQRDNQGKFIRTHCIFQDITEQKKIEKQLNITLKESEEGRQTLEALMENIPMGITIADKDLRLKRVSRHGLEMMGWAKERHLGLSVEQILSEWDVYLADGITKARLEQLPLPRAIMNGETVFGQEIVQRHADGRTIPLNCDAGPIRDSQGRITGGIVAWQDMTERKRAVERLKESEAFIKATLDNLPVGVAINSVDPKVHFTYMNDNFARFYRTTKEELAPPNDFWEVVYQDPEFREIIKKRVVEDCAGNDPDRMYWKDVPVSRPGQETFYITAKNIPLPESDLMVSTVWDVTDRKLTEDRLRESEARLRSIYENTAVGLARISLDFNIMSANKAYCEMLGYQEKDLIGRHLREITHPDSLEQDIEKQSKLAAGEIDHYRMEKKFIHKNGQTVYAILDANTIRDVSGENLYFLGSVLDITERKRAQKDLEKIEWMLSKKPYSEVSRQEEVHDQGYGDLTRLNRDGIILKYVGKELLGNIAEDYLDLLETSSAVYEQNGDYAFGIFASGWCRMMDRASRDLCDTPDNVQALNSGRWLCHESCWTDCSKEAIAGGTPMDIECSGGIRLYAEPIFAWGKVIGVINFGYGDPPREPEKLRQLAKTYGLNYDALEKESYAHDSRPPYIIELAKNRLRASARLIGSLVEVRMAQEEREKLQSQLLQAQKMESIGILAGGIAHDFNNLLHAMGGNLELLDMKIPDDHPGKKRIHTIQRSMGRAAQLVKKLLLFTRKADIQTQVLDLNQEIHDASRLLERSIPRMISIELILDENAWPINADPIQVEQVLLNLGTNAADAMPDGGRLIIETASVTLDQDFVRTYTGAKPGKYVLMTVSDTGCGMDKETLQHIFDPFFTTKEVGKGTGLGLASVYGIVKAHEGYVSCYSEVVQGTTFKIYWPAAEQGEIEPDEIQTEQAVLQDGTETILVVDDDDEIRDLARELLEDSGYRVLGAASGEQALKIFTEHAKEIDLVVMDLNMPGMGGRKCTREMLSIDPSVKVLVASGYSANGHGREALEFGAKNFISKPYQMREILAKIREVLDGDQR